MSLFLLGTVTETLVGNLEIKTIENIQFAAYSDILLNAASTVGFYSCKLWREREHDGCGAMERFSGIFTAPVDGLYYFQYFIKGIHNETIMSWLEVSAIGADINHNDYRNHFYAPKLKHFTVTATYIKLKAGEKVRMNIYPQNKNSNFFHLNVEVTFSGCLVEEYLKLD